MAGKLWPSWFWLRGLPLAPEEWGSHRKSQCWGRIQSQPVWNHTSLHSPHPTPSVASPSLSLFQLSVWIFSFSVFHQLSTTRSCSLMDSLSSHFWHGSWLQAALAVRSRFNLSPRGPAGGGSLLPTPSTNYLMLSRPSRARTFLPDTTAHYKSFRDAWFKKEHTDIYSMWGEQSVFTAHKSPHLPLSSQWDLTCKTVCRLWYHLSSTCASIS